MKTVVASLLCAVMIADGGATGIQAEIHPREVIEAQEVEPEEAKPEGKHLWGTCTITHYCGCSACCGAWGNATASGATPTAGWTVASNCLPFGTKVEINGHTYCVEDRGDSNMDDFWIDIYCGGHQEALDRGMYQTEVYIIDG